VKEEIDLDGYIDEKNNVRYVGKAVRQPNGKYICLVVVGNSLCRAECTITPKTENK